MPVKKKKKNENCRSMVHIIKSLEYFLYENVTTNIFPAEDAS